MHSGRDMAVYIHMGAGVGRGIGRRRRRGMGRDTQRDQLNDCTGVAWHSLFHLMGAPIFRPMASSFILAAALVVPSIHLLACNSCEKAPCSTLHTHAPSCSLKHTHVHFFVYTYAFKFTVALCLLQHTPHSCTAHSESN